MNLKELRRARGLSIEHIAVLAGVHKSTISRAERGLQRLQPQTVVRLSRALGVSPSRIADSE